MTRREILWRRARRWVCGWQGGKSVPTAEMAYIAGWNAAMRQMQKASDLAVKLASQPMRSDG